MWLGVHSHVCVNVIIVGWSWLDKVLANVQSLVVNFTTSAPGRYLNTLVIAFLRLNTIMKLVITWSRPIYLLRL